MEQKIQHLGIIMDGNRRWAKARGLAPFKGHEVGYKKIEEVLSWCKEAGIEILTLYAFSIENWQRARKEVDFLMKLSIHALTKDIKKLHENKVRVRVIGRREGLSEKLRRAIEESEELTKNNDGGTLNLAINYGGRPELVDAFNKILRSRIDADQNADKRGYIGANQRGNQRESAFLEEITEEDISKNLYAADLPDPDLIIRTSGEQRLSGFLTWQSAYSELYFMEHHWPEFSREDFDAALADFANRQRRFGK